MAMLGQYQYAAICTSFLKFLQSHHLPLPIRVLFLIIEHSWGTPVPPPGYRGDDRRKFLPSLTAVSKVFKSERSGFWVVEPLRAKQIAEKLGQDEGNISTAIKWLEVRKVISSDNRRFAPCAAPLSDAPKKLLDLTTFWSQNPLFQQLEKIRLEIEAALEEAKQKALEPVLELYRPKLEEVNTQQKKLKREINKAVKRGVSPAEVVGSHNFKESNRFNETN